MADDQSKEALEEELRLVEEEIAELRPLAEDLRQRIGGRDDDPTDVVERGAMIETAEEQEAILGRLEERRSDLLRRLGKE